MRALTIKKFCELVYADSNGLITSVSSDESGYHVVFSFDDWRGVGKARRFDLVFHDVAESTARPSASMDFFVEVDHPLLWNHNIEQSSIYFSSAPEEPDTLIGQLYEAHGRLLGRSRALASYLNADASLLRLGYGLLAVGPAIVVDAYARVVNDRLRYSIVRTHTPKGGYRVAMFDECFVVFRELEIFELTEPG